MDNKQPRQEVNTGPKACGSKQPYSCPKLVNAGNLVELTNGFSGSIPDEQGAHTKRNPFLG